MTNYDENLRILAKSQNVNELLRGYKNVISGKKEGTLVEPIRVLTDEITNGDPNLENILMNATPQAVENEIANYHARNRDTVNTALNESKDQIVEDYVSSLDKIIQNIAEQISSQDGFDELSAKQKDAIIRPELCMALAQLLEGLDPRDKEYIRAKQGLEGIDKVSETEKYSDVIKYLRGTGLSSNAINLVNSNAFYNNAIRPQKVDLYTRVLANKLLVGKNGKYSVSENKFDKVYGSDENYKKIALDLVAQKQAANRAA